MAFPTASPGKSWTRTRSGSPVGCHSRPVFVKSPTNSFFFVSTEITGCPRELNAAGVAIGMRGAFARLLQRMQAIAEPVQELPDRRRTHGPALRGQRAGQFRGAL